MPKSADRVVPGLPGANDLESPGKVESLFSDRYSRLLNKRETAQYLSLSENSVDRLRKRRVIPFLIVGGSIRFKLADVERALERYRVKEVSL
jgi:excisionase family DNA binding protein